MLLRCSILLLLSFVQRSSALTVFSDDPGESCTIIGDPDLYGIGVRLSYYLSFAAAVLATLCGLTDELTGTRRGIIIVTTAVLIDTIISNTKGSFSILETYIMTLETIGLAGPCFWPSITKKAVKQSQSDEGEEEQQLRQLFPYELSKSTKADAGLFGMFFAIQVIVLCLTPWIYFTLQNQGYKDGCEVTTFFFASFNIYARGWTGFMKFSAVVNVFTSITLIPVCAWILIYAMRASWKHTEEEEDEEKEEADHNDSSSKWTLRIFKVAMMVVSGSISALFAERVIGDNDINMDDATLASGSQLIAFLVGFFNFVFILWKCIMTVHFSKIFPLL